MNPQANQTITNLDIRCAELGRELADIKGMEKKVLNQALTVLEEQGVYAMFLYIQARHGQIAGPFKKQCGKLLRDVFGATFPQDALEAAKKLAGDLDNLCFASELLRNALAYAHYHLKAKGSDS